MSQAASIRLSLRSSRRLGSWLSVMHAGVLVPLWSSGISLSIAAALTTCLAGHVIWTVWRHALLCAPGSATAVEVCGGDCAITQRDGRVLRGRVADSSVVTGWLVILAVKLQSWRPPARIVVVADMCSPEAFRQLRVVLRSVPAEPSGSGTSSPV